MFNTYDAMGNLKKSVQQLYGAGQWVTTSNYDYTKFDSYKQNQITSTRSDNTGNPGKTTLNYDVNGYLTAITDEDKSKNNRSFINDVSGQVLKKTQESNVLKNLVVNGQVLGTYGTGIDQDKTPVVSKVKVQITLHVNSQNDNGSTSEFRLKFKAGDKDSGSDPIAIDDVANDSDHYYTLTGVTWPPADGILRVSVTGRETDGGDGDPLPDAIYDLATNDWTREGQEFTSAAVQNSLASYYLKFKVYTDQATTSYNDSVKNFSTYQIVDAAHPGSGPSSYRVNAGDSLQSIAQMTYGDAALWYLIADANGLSSSSRLQAGTMLTLPNTVGTIHNNASTFKPYNPANIIGNTTPHLVEPAGSQPCKQMGTIINAIMIASMSFCPGLGMILMAQKMFVPQDQFLKVATITLSVAAAIAISAVTLGAASALGAGIVGLAIAGAVGGTLGTLASQGIMVGSGLQDHISWGDVAIGGVMGLAGGALGGYAKGVADAGKALSLGQKIMTASLSGAKTAQGAGLLFAKVATYAAVNATANAVGQGLKIAIDGGSFDWKSVAAAGVQGGFGSVGGFGKQGSLLEKGSDFTFNSLGDISANLIMNDGKFDPTQFVTDLAGSSFSMGLNTLTGKLQEKLKNRSNAIIINPDQQGDSLAQAKLLAKKKGKDVPIFSPELGENGQVTGLRLIQGKARDLNGAKLAFVGHNDEKFGGIIRGVAANLRENGVQNIRKAAIIACQAAASNQEGASLVKQAFDAFKAQGMSTEVTGHTGRIQLGAGAQRIVDSFNSQKLSYSADGSVTSSPSRHVGVMEDGWLGKGKKRSRDGEAQANTLKRARPNNWNKDPEYGAPLRPEKGGISLGAYDSSGEIVPISGPMTLAETNYVTTMLRKRWGLWSVNNYKANTFNQPAEQFAKKFGTVTADHIPSFEAVNQAQMSATGVKLNRNVTGAGKVLAEKNTATMNVPQELHEALSSTFGARNKNGRPQADSLNLKEATARDIGVYKQYLERVYRKGDITHSTEQKLFDFMP